MNLKTMNNQQIFYMIQEACFCEEYQYNWYFNEIFGDQISIIFLHGGIIQIESILIHQYYKNTVVYQCY